MENLQLTALVPADMEPAQKQLIQWCDNKIASLKAEAKEFGDSITELATMQWATRPMKRQLDKVNKRILFFDKMKTAIEAGYVVVPNFPIQLFAIRTKFKNPLPKRESSYWGSKEQKAQELAIGQGEYQNPFPVVERERTELEKGKTESNSYATDWAEMEFPLTMAKPEIIEATNRAMLLECFDQIGIMPATKNEDPVIIGQIINSRKTLSFMIAWHFDTKVL